METVTRREKAYQDSGCIFKYPGVIGFPEDSKGFPLPGTPVNPKNSPPLVGAHTRIPLPSWEGLGEG